MEGRRVPAKFDEESSMSKNTFQSKCERLSLLQDVYSIGGIAQKFCHFKGFPQDGVSPLHTAKLEKN